MISRCWHLSEDKKEITTLNEKLFLIKCDKCERGFIAESDVAPSLPEGWVTERKQTPGDTLYHQVKHYCVTCALLK